MDIFEIEPWSTQTNTKTLITIIPTPQPLRKKLMQKPQKQGKTQPLKGLSSSEKKLHSLKASLQAKDHEMNLVNKRSFWLGFPQRTFGECGKQMYYRNRLIRSISHTKHTFSNPMAILRTSQNAEFKKSLEKGMSYLKNRRICSKSIS